MKTIAAIGMAMAGVLAASPSHALDAFTAGDLVVTVEGNGVYGATSGPYADNQAAPLSLFEYLQNGTSSAAYAGTYVLPQTTVGDQSAISGEYGSSSEGTLQLSANGEYLTLMGYGVNAGAFNADPSAYGSSTGALAQSGSLTSQGYTPVPRVVALIAADGSSDTSTTVYNVFNENNPRSAYTVDGSSIYISGQGNSPDATGGVFLASRGATSATPITGLDTNGMTSSQDTREVQVYNGQLYVSVDSKEGKGSNRDFIGTLGTQGNLPTGLANGGNGPTMLPGFGSSDGHGKLTITAGTTNGVNAPGDQINLSPEDFYFANATTLYVADTGAPKNTSGSSPLGDGGLQKWSLVGGSWTLDYTVAAGLNLVANTSSAGTTGLYGLTGKLVGGQVELYATNYTINDTDPTYLFGLTDSLDATTLASGESFTTLADAPADSTFKGVAFAPEASAAPEPAAWALMLAGVGLAGAALRRRRGDRAAALA